MIIELNQDQMRDIEEMFKDFPGGAIKATCRAINRSLETGKTLAAKEIGMRLNVTQTRIKQDIKLSNAYSNKPVGRIDSTGMPVSLTTFTGTKPTLKGVSVNVLTTTPRTIIKHAFMNLSNNAMQVFWRVYKPAARRPKNPLIKYGNNLPDKYRYEIEIRKGPRIQDIYARPEVYGAVLAKVNTYMMERLDHEANYLLSQYQSKLYGAD
jgi:hypothetical protein